MSDGRLFTDYRANCSILGTHTNADYENKQRLTMTGVQMMGTDRSLTVMRAGSTGCVDTMVPELTKRVCGWNGCVTLPAQPVGIGQGRLYLPGRPDLAAADPDVVAKATFPMAGTFSMNPDLYVASPSKPVVSGHVVPARPNRYSAPYGN
jgi:hypothetical protein